MFQLPNPAISRIYNSLGMMFTLECFTNIKDYCFEQMSIDGFCNSVSCLACCKLKSGNHIGIPETENRET